MIKKGGKKEKKRKSVTLRKWLSLCDWVVRSPLGSLSWWLPSPAWVSPVARQPVPPSFPEAWRCLPLLALSAPVPRVNCSKRGNGIFLISLLKKFPKAFMHIGWMENDFRNLTAQVWANLDSPIKSYDFSQFWLISCMLPSQVALS